MLGEPNFSIDHIGEKTHLLSELCKGQSGRIAGLSAEPKLALAMLEMGLVCGRRVKFLQAASLGGPVAIDIGGSILSLRRDEARSVLVTLD